MVQGNTGRDATDIVIKWKPLMSPGLSRRNAEGGGCSVWLPGSTCSTSKNDSNVPKTTDGMLLAME
jgi:hypothetical protein